MFPIFLLHFTFTFPAPTFISKLISTSFTPFPFHISPKSTPMLKPDFDTLLRSASGGGGADGRVACETVLQSQLPPADDIPDFPPESFFIPADEELEWLDRNAVVVARSSSTRGSFHPSASPGVKTSSSSSRRGSVKSRASIIGLPKYPDSGHLRRSVRRSCPRQGLWVATKRAPRRDSSSGAEPGSPKVSCLGRVRSKSRSRRCRSIRERAAALPALAPVEKSSPAKKKSSGFWGPIIGIFRLRRRGRGTAGDSVEKILADSSIDVEKEAAGILRRGSVVESAATAAAAPRLGGMKRFSSGRRADSWGGDEVRGACRGGEQSPEL